MYPPTLIHACLLAFLITLSVFASPSPEPFPLVSIPNRNNAGSITSRRPTEANSINGHHDVDVNVEEVDLELDYDVLPFVIISTLDGGLHAVERETGRLKWSLSEGVEPLVGGGVKGAVGAGEEEYIVEPLTGGLFVFDEDDNDANSVLNAPPKLRKLPLSVEQLIELSPFTFPHAPSRIFTGSKQTSLLTIDLRTGQQLDCFSSYSPWGSVDEGICENDILDDLEGSSRHARDTLFVGRADYRLTIHTPALSFSSSSWSSNGNNGGSEVVGAAATILNDNSSARGSNNATSNSGPRIQEIMYSTYTPNSFDKPLAHSWTKRSKDRWNAQRMRVELGHDGVAVGVKKGFGSRWVTRLDSVGIAVYDILLPLASQSSSPVLVPQPPPDLELIFPVSAQRHPALDKPPSTYIGSVPFTLSILPPGKSNPSSPESGKDNASLPRSSSSSSSSSSRPLLYALSSSSYPLINFAPPPRPGALSNGSFVVSEDEELGDRDYSLPKLLDPPKDVAPTPDPAAESERQPQNWINERDEPRLGWWWWGVGVLGAVFICAGVVLHLARGSAAAFKTSISATDKKTSMAIMSDEVTSLITPTTEKSYPLLLASPPTIPSTPKLGPVTAPPIPKTPSSTGLLTLPVGDETPKKKSTRRRVRGKKKSRNANMGGVGGAGEDGDEGEDDADEKDCTSSSLSVGNSTTPESRMEKPLPDLPRELSSTGLPDEKERLSISDTVIGFGSHGTVVLKGTWGGRPVAVKRLLSDFVRLASQEVKLLQASDDHPNVIRYYCQERRDNFLYIALDLCDASLADIMESPDKHIELAAALDRKRALQQITAGVKHLHGMKIIHRDIKPQNVLVSKAKDGSLRMLVSDFGLARRLDQGQSSFAPTANNLAGSLGWRAPECIRGTVRLNDGFDLAHSSSSNSSSSSLCVLNGNGDEDERRAARDRLTKAVDLFALGCLYFWVLLNGEHPFGETYNRESNIVKGDAVNLNKLEILGEEGVEAMELIENLLSANPSDRPDTSDCLIHPFFWTPAKRLAFLCDASDRFENMETEPPEPTLVQLETNAALVVGKDWFSRLDRVFTSSLGKYRKYKGNSVRDLLRAMRNKKHHYQDLEPAQKRHLGNLPNGFLNFFTSRYPRLFLHVHGVVKDSRLRHESMFESYFREGGYSQ